MLHQLSTEVADLYKQETWSSEPMGDHGFVTPLVIDGSEFTLCLFGCVNF